MPDQSASERDLKEWGRQARKAGAVFKQIAEESAGEEAGRG